MGGGGGGGGGGLSPDAFFCFQVDGPSSNTFKEHPGTRLVVTLAVRAVQKCSKCLNLSYIVVIRSVNRPGGSYKSFLQLGN